MNTNSIVPFIKGQFPQYIQETGTLLIPFMEAYYEWMGLTNNIYDVVNDISKLHNIDESLDKFSEQFSSEYLQNFPKDFITDKSLTIKHINDLYKAKGTPAATKLLIKLVLGKDSEIFYPSTQILKPSDGEWVQENSIYVSVISGNIFDMVGNSVKISTSLLTFNSVVEKIKSTPFAGIYEIFLERKLVYNITNNSIISYNNIVVSSQQTTTSYRILNGGYGFKVGQLFTIDSAQGFGTIVKIKTTNTVGSITAIQIIKFGFGYTYNFVVEINANNLVSTIPVSIFPNPQDVINNIHESGSINNYDYASIGYINETYVGDILATFVTTSLATTIEGNATIEFILGNKLKYPGYYNNVNGFLSDSIYIQNEYYQPYSYVVKVDEFLSKYKNSLLNTVHPAGLKLFSEYSINNNFKLNTKLSFILNFFRVIVSDAILTLDYKSLNISKILTDIVTSLDTKSLSIYTLYSDLVVNSDFNINNITKVLTDNTINIENYQLDISKYLTDIASVFDNTGLYTNISKSDMINTIDNITIGYLFNLDFTDTSTNTDAGVLYLNYYTEPSYWDSSYSAGSTTF